MFLNYNFSKFELFYKRKKKLPYVIHKFQRPCPKQIKKEIDSHNN